MIVCAGCGAKDDGYSHHCSECGCNWTSSGGKESESKMNRKYAVINTKDNDFRVVDSAKQAVEVAEGYLEGDRNETTRDDLMIVAGDNLEIFSVEVKLQLIKGGKQ